MASTFPSTLDNFSNNVDTDTIYAQDVNDLNDAVEALEAKVGIDDSAVSTSIDYILKNKIWPIGSVFTAVVSTNPNTLLGFGTWSQIAGGKVLIGQTDSDADFNVAEETGGAKVATLTTTELPAHSHTGSTLGNESAHVHAGPSHVHGVTDPTHTHSTNYSDAGSDVYQTSTGNYGPNITNQTPTTAASTGISIQAGGTGNTGAGSSHTHALTIASAGSGTAFSIMNPYFCVYFWKRTA